jgi:hypothetical protein
MRSFCVVTLNAAGYKLLERCFDVAMPFVMTAKHKRSLAERALQTMGMADAYVHSVYGDNGEVYVDLVGTDSDDDIAVSLRISEI